MKYTVDTNHVCAKKIDFDFDGNVVTNVVFTGGCPGNLKAISALVEGLTPQDIIEKCEGITCRDKDTSCTDQLTKALTDVVKNLEK